MWTAPTYKDTLVDGSNPLARCACGRQQSADMMVDIRRLPAAQREQWGLQGDYVCDACRERPVLQGRCTREAFAKALGAPADVLARVQAHTQRRERA